MSTNIIRLTPNNWVVITSGNELDQCEQFYYGLIRYRHVIYNENIEEFDVLFVRNANKEFPNVKFHRITVGEHSINNDNQLGKVGRILVMINELHKESKITTVSYNTHNRTFLESTVTISNETMEIFRSLINSVEHMRVGVSVRSFRIKK